MNMALYLCGILLLLDVRSLAVAGRSRQSEKQPIIEHAHYSVREEHWRRVTDKVITIEQAKARFPWSVFWSGFGADFVCACSAQSTRCF